jgi:hypothetical protein
MKAVRLKDEAGKRGVLRCVRLKFLYFWDRDLLCPGIQLTMIQSSFSDR